MQDTFLNIYPKIANNQTSERYNLSGLWLAHGDEPLLHQWLIDAMRSTWRTQSLMTKRVDLLSPKSWQDVLSELNSLSLFDDATAVVVTGNHKPDKYTQDELEAFALESQSGNNDNCLLWLTAKIDKRGQSSKWFVPFAKLGNVIDCNLYNENQRQQLLSIHANRFGLNLTSDAWQFLMLQTEHHLLSAYQALWRLSYLFADKISQITPDTPTNLVDVDVEALQNALVSDAQYSVFDLSDAMLAGNTAQVIKIVEQLRATDEPTPLVLWAINKDMRLIMQLMDGQDPQSIGIWRNKQSLFQNACRRHSPHSTADWSDILYQCDKAVKGVIRQPAWELILQAALRVTGVKLFA